MALSDLAFYVLRLVVAAGIVYSVVFPHCTSRYPQWLVLPLRLLALADVSVYALYYSLGWGLLAGGIFVALIGLVVWLIKPGGVIWQWRFWRDVNHEA